MDVQENSSASQTNQWNYRQGKKRCEMCEGQITNALMFTIPKYDPKEWMENER